VTRTTDAPSVRAAPAGVNVVNVLEIDVVLEPGRMPDEARIKAAIANADRYLNGWHGGPSARERLAELAEVFRGA